MRLWLIVLMVAIALSSVPLLRNSIRRAITTSVWHSIPKVATSVSFSTKLPTQQITNMAEATQANPMPVLSKAGPADAQKAEELPKLSASDFRVYNRLAVMMDAYVSIFKSFIRA